MKTRYIVKFVDRYEPHLQETLFFMGKLTTLHILSESTDDPSFARLFTTYEKAARVALALANRYGEDYKFYVEEMKGGRA